MKLKIDLFWLLFRNFDLCQIRDVPRLRSKVTARNLCFLKNFFSEPTTEPLVKMFFSSRQWPSEIAKKLSIVKSFFRTDISQLKAWVLSSRAQAALFYFRKIIQFTNYGSWFLRRNFHGAIMLKSSKNFDKFTFSFLHKYWLHFFHQSLHW